MHRTAVLTVAVLLLTACSVPRWPVDGRFTSPFGVRSDGMSLFLHQGVDIAVPEATPTGELVLLEDQDRSRWDRREIDEGHRVLERALSLRRPGPYQLQAAITALHAEASTPEETDWAQIAALYAELARSDPSPIVELNRAVAVAMAEGPAHGLSLVDRIPGLDRYHLLHATRADLLRRLGRTGEAASAYGRALELATHPAERGFLERRLAELA
jgi:predicted RNA polymerase sigma factor